MKDERTKLSEQVGLFRLSVLGDLVHLLPCSPGIGEAIAERAAKDYDIPSTLRTRVAPETIRGWLKDKVQRNVPDLPHRLRSRK